MMEQQHLSNHQKHIDFNSHRRGEGLLARTQMKHQGRFGLLKKFFNIVFFIFVFFLSQSFAQEPNMTTKTYQSSDATIINPERGFRFAAEINANSSFSTYYEAMGVSLVHAYVRLDDYREQDLSQEFLNDLQVGFDNMRGSGVKTVLRFSYNFGPYPDTEPDASKEQILRHIEQLTPTLQKNADVIAWLQAGFIGAWGEWHTSTNGLDNLTDKQQILSALLAALPKDRTIQVRYPSNIIEMFPEPLTAFGESDQARVGFHNDCFLSSETDVGTYERGDSITIERDQTYLAELTKFTPAGGETCAVFPPRTDCETALKELALLHFTELNQSYHAQVIRGWKRQGCFEEIQKRLGYRLVLKSATFASNAQPGEMLELKVELENTGFASLMNPRPLILVLDGPERYELATDIDPRSWQPGASSFSVSLEIPSDVVAGDYQLTLWLPDAYDTLRDNPRYAVQFANEETWNDEKGYNVLGEIRVEKR
jgi:Domain of unknown function (DUF4832)/Domain of unknown function (DUF4874)